MKKLITTGLLVLLGFVLLGFSEPAQAKETDDYNIGEIERKLLDYFEENNINLEIGTDAFAEYLSLQLLEDKDKNLSNHPDYNLILFYAGEYLFELEKQLVESPNDTNQSMLVNLENNKKFNLDHIKNKTIKQIKKEIKKQDEADAALLKEVEKEKQQKNQTNSNISIMATYSGTAAAAYAKEYATRTNPNYIRYSNNCTNFVSQAVYAGGKAEKKPSSIPTGSYETTSYWYQDSYYACTGSNSCYWRSKDSTSYIRVTDFYSYWTKQGMSAVTSSSQSTIINNAIVGDVVQFRKSDGRWFHSVLVNRKANDTIYIASNTSDYYDKNFKNTSENMYRVIKMR